MADPGRSETLTDERADDATQATTDTATDTSTDTSTGTTPDTSPDTSTDTPDTSTDTSSDTAPSTDADAEAATSTGADGTTDDAPAAATDTDDTDDTDDPDDTLEGDDDESPQRPWALIAATTVAALAVVALAVTALLVPGWAINPGSPDSVAEQATAALAAKDPAQLDAVSCRNQQGVPTNPFPPDALTLIQQATPAGPPTLELDTQARAPVDLVLSAQGQTQQLPADIVMGVTDGQWCMAGISQRA